MRTGLRRLYLLCALSLALMPMPPATAQPPVIMERASQSRPASARHANIAGFLPRFPLIVAVAPTNTLAIEPTGDTLSPSSPSSTPEPGVPKASPDLSTSIKSVEPSLVRAGDPLTYTIVLRNSGDGAATADLSDPLPSHTSYVASSAAATSGTIAYDSGSNTITWQGVIDAGTTVTVTFQARVTAGTAANTVITNTATLDDHTNPPLLLTAAATVRSRANLSGSTKSVDRGSALPGEVLTYTIALYNSGNALAAGTNIVVDPIPTGTSYVAGSIVNGTYDAATNSVRWSGSLPALATFQIRFRVRLDDGLAAGTSITNTAAINDAGQTIYRQAPTTIAAAPNLQASAKAVAPSAAASGDVVTYTLSLSNTGTITATALVTDSLPPGLVMLGSPSASAGAVQYDDGAHRVRWQGSISTAQTVWVTYTMQATIAPTATARYTNTALINDGVHAPFTRTATLWVPRLRLEGPSESVYAGSAVDVPLWVDNVPGLHRFAAQIQFPAAMVEVTDVAAGEWFSPLAWDTRTWNNVTGVLDLAAHLSEAGARSGSGVLAIVRLRARAAGVAALTFASSSLWDSDTQTLAHNVLDGAMTISPRQARGTVLLQGRTNHSGARVLANGMPVAVTGADGSYVFPTPADQFTVTVTMPGYLWAARMVSAGSATSVTLPAVTLLTGDVVGSNRVVSRPITCTGDLTETLPGLQDGVIDVQDVAFVMAKVGLAVGETGWGPDPCFPWYAAHDARNFALGYLADVNGDGSVNVQDLQLVRNNYGRRGPSPWP
ncbi:MAG: DUF7927 domain-containing protein [Anaerolineae bacterium]